MSKRETKITRNYLKYPAGSVLIETGDTKVICSVTVETGVPGFIRNAEPPQGWITAEYSMLPGAPNSRFRRERSGVKGRTAEIQRLIGRSLRAVIDMTKFPGYQLIFDCDVLQADGGTRTAAITGACIAAYDAFNYLLDQNKIAEMPLREWVAAISVGIVDGKPMIDLDYELDSNADVDMNVVMTENGKFVEIQGTAEAEPFSDEELQILLALAKEGIAELVIEQRTSVGLD